MEKKIRILRNTCNKYFCYWPEYLHSLDYVYPIHMVRSKRKITPRRIQ